MAKLPNKKKSTATEEVTDTEVLETTEVEEATEEDQTAAVESLLNNAAENAASVEDSADEEEDTSGDENADSAVNEDSENEAGENPETAPPEKEDDNAVIVSTPPKATPRDTLVRVATIADHSCYIGGVPYHFKKGVSTNVPKPVKEILRNAGLLMPL